MSKLKEALLKAGLDEATIADLEKQDGTITVDEAVQKVKAHIYGLAKNDNEFLEPIRKDNTGRIHAGLRKKLKEFFGVEEVEGKTTEDLLQMAAEMSKAQLLEAKTNGADKEAVKKLQDDLVAANNALKQMQEVDLPKAQEAAKAEIEAFRFDMALTSKLASKTLVVGSDIATMAVKARLAENGYNAKLENGALVILTKDGTKPFNEDRTKVLEADDVLQSILDKEGLIKHQPTPPAGGNNGTPPDEKKLNANLNQDAVKRAQERIEKAKAGQN